MGRRPDAVVVGSGGGLCGAVTAAAAGLETLVIEKESRLNPITRVTGSIVMMAAVFSPLLLQAAWDASARMQRVRPPVAEEST